MFGAGLALNHPSAVSSTCAPPTHTRCMKARPNVYTCAFLCTHEPCQRAQQDLFSTNCYADTIQLSLVTSAHDGRTTVSQRHRVVFLVLGLGTGSAGKLGASPYAPNIFMRQCGEVTVQTVFSFSTYVSATRQTSHPRLLSCSQIRVNVSITCGHKSLLSSF